jgi:fumarate hydratase class II
MNPTTSRAAVRSMATLAHATRATPAARNLLSAAVRSPAIARSLSSNTRQFAQFPRLQSFTFSNKRAFGSTARMVCLGSTVNKRT